MLTVFCMVFTQSCFILHYYYNHLENIPRLKNKIFYISMGVNSLLFLSVLGQLLLVIFFRLSFSGRVCSGEYLKRDGKRPDDINVYLIPEGRNLLAIIILELLLLPLVGLAIKLRRPHLKRMAEIRKLEEEQAENERMGGQVERGSDSVRFGKPMVMSEHHQSHASIKFS